MITVLSSTDGLLLFNNLFIIIIIIISIIISIIIIRIRHNLWQSLNNSLYVTRILLNCHVQMMSWALCFLFSILLQKGNGELFRRSYKVPSNTKDYNPI